MIISALIILAQDVKKLLKRPSKIFLFFFLITNFKSIRCQKNTIEDKKCELGLIIKEVTELIDLYKFRFEKNLQKF